MITKPTQARRLIAVILVFTIAFSMCSAILMSRGSVTEVVASSGKRQISLYDSEWTRENNLEHTAMNIEGTIAVQFNALVPFDRIGVVCPSYANNIGSLTLSLYKWDIDYDVTVEGEPVAQKVYENFNDNSTLTLSTDEPLEGEYVFMLEQPVEQVGVWVYDGAMPDNTNVYLNGTEYDIAFDGYIRFTERTTEDTYFGEISPAFVRTAVITPPPESTISDDSAIHNMNVQPDTWLGVDGLGRRLLDTYENSNNPSGDRYVGLFYWTWHYANGQSHTARNVTQLLAQAPEAVNDFSHELWENTGSGTPYFWDEPLFGYYSNLDEYVVRKHAEMLADALVDVIVFDCTNATLTWTPAYKVLLEVFAQAREEGVKTPQIAFMLNFAANNNSRIELKTLFGDIYKKGEYQDLWFYWKGKPLIMAHRDCLDLSDPEDKMINNFFTFRKNDPSYFSADTAADDAPTWGWCSVYPQTKFMVSGDEGDEDRNIEQMTVSVAQNASRYGLVAMNDYRGGVFGRAYTNGDYSYSYLYRGVNRIINKDTEDAYLYGLNFQQQWDYAIENDPEFIFVTGWNEWIAGRHDEWQGTENAFPDQFNYEFSRDVEPSSGVLKDHYYYQLIANIRRYKGIKTYVNNSQPTLDDMIDINKGEEQWNEVLPEYTHYINSTWERDADGWVGLHYTGQGIRNDVVSAKVAYSNEYVCFLVKTANDITPYTDDMWMRLLIDTNLNDDTGNWEGFEYILNRTSPSSTEAVLERSLGGWDFEEVGRVAYTVSGNIMQVQIPKDMLGIDFDSQFCFKWCDNNLSDGDIMELYTDGEAAPGGRMTFQYGFGSNESTPSSMSSETIFVIIAISIAALISVAAVIVIVRMRKKAKS